MNAAGRSVSGKDDLPEFDLEYYYDDPDDPEEVTVFHPNSADMTTTWITANIDHTVPLSRIV